MRPTSIHGIRLAAVATAGLLALTACGEKSTPSSAGSPASNKATGSPILVGFINDDQGPAPFPEVTTGAKAAVSYVNSQGGVNNHPIQLVTCSSSASPESTVSCANEMISKKVVAVTLGSVIGADALLKPLKEAAIPIYATNGQGSALLDDPYPTFASMPKVLVFAGVWKFFKQVKTTKPVLIAPDLGAAGKQLAEQAIIPSAKAAGLDLSVTFYNPAAPDFAAAITAAKKKGADGLYILGTEADCTNGVKTAKQLQWTGILFGGTCTQYAKVLGAKAAGVYTLNFQIPSTAIASAPAAKKDQVQLYIDQLKAAGAADKAASPAMYGFSDVMTISDMLRKVSGEVTVANAATAISTYAGDVFMAAPVDCTKRPVPGGSCGTNFVALKTEADGTQSVVSGDFIDATKA
jgi:branched-chain amino acid transport system substrate-binding protein